MKKLFCIISVLVCVLTFSGCVKDEEPADPSKVPQIMMLNMYENWACGETYKLTVYTNTGEVGEMTFYRDPRDPDSSEPTPEWASAVDSEDWYERLSEIAGSAEDKSELSEEKLRLALSNALSFCEWNDMPFKESARYAFDAGRNDFYGVYFDENGEPQKTLIATYGDHSECRNNAGCRKFTNVFLDLRGDYF